MRPLTTAWPVCSERILESPPPQADTIREDRVAANIQRGLGKVGIGMCMVKRLRALTRKLRQKTRSKGRTALLATHLKKTESLAEGMLKPV